MDDFVEMIIDALRGDETLQHESDIQGRVTFYDRANSAGNLEISLEVRTPATEEAEGVGPIEQFLGPVKLGASWEMQSASSQAFS